MVLWSGVLKSSEIVWLVRGLTLYLYPTLFCTAAFGVDRGVWRSWHFRFRLSRYSSGSDYHP